MKLRLTLVICAIAGICMLTGCSGNAERQHTGSGTSDAIVKKISDGEKVDLTAHLANDKHTVFFFYADW